MSGRSGREGYWESSFYVGSFARVSRREGRDVV